MDVLKILGFAIISVILIVVLKEQKKEIALIMTIFACVILMLFAMTKMESVIGVIESLINKSGINKDFFLIILKVTGIAYLIEFGKNICIDAGQKSIATKLEMAGKVIILTISLPVISALVNVISGLI